MRSRLVCYLSLSPLLLLLLATTACVTTSNSESQQVPTTTDGEDPATVGEDNVPAAKPDTLALGPIEDVDIKEVIYQGIEKQLLATETENTKVEIGDFESFKFSIIKMTNTASEIGDIPSEEAATITAEVTGWYKRGTDGDENAEKCFSFDTHVVLTSESEMWLYDEQAPLKFTRENTEDCY